MTVCTAQAMIALGLGAALFATTALARPPGPDEIGEFYCIQCHAMTSIIAIV